MKAKKILWFALVLSVIFLCFPTITILGDKKTVVDSSSGTIGSVFQTPSELIESGKTNEEKLKETEEKGEIPKTKEEVLDSTFSNPVSEAVAAGNSGEDFIDRDLTYENFKDDLKYFTSKVYFKDDFFGYSSETNYLFNSFIQGVFWVTKFIFKICADIYGAISNFGSIDGYITTVIDASAEIYHSLISDTMLVFIGGLFAVYAFFMYATGKGGFFRTLFKLFVVYAATFIFFSKAPTGDYYLTRAYNNMNSVFANIAADVSGSTEIYGSGEDMVLDNYFERAIWQPYAYMNADRTDEPADGSSLGLNLSDDQLKALLAYEQDDGDFKVGDESISKLANKKDTQVKNLTNNWGEKASYAFGSIINALVLGVVNVFFGLVAVVFKVMLLIIFAFSWLYLIISLFPGWSGVLINFGKRAGILSGLSAFMTFLSGMFMYIYNILSNFILDLTDNYLLTVFLNVMILYLTYRFRGQIIGVITGDRLNLTGAGSRLRSRWSAYRRRRSSLRSSGNFDLSKMALARASVKGFGKRGFKNLNRKREELTRGFKARRMAEDRGVSTKQARSLVDAQSDYQKAKRQSMKEQLANRINRSRAMVYQMAAEGVSNEQMREELANRSKKYQDRIVNPNKALEKADVRYKGHKEHLERVAKRNSGVKQIRQNANNRFMKDQVSALSKQKGVSPKKAYKEYSHNIRKQRRLKGEPDRLTVRKPKVKRVKTREV